MGIGEKQLESEVKVDTEQHENPHWIGFHALEETVVAALRGHPIRRAILTLMLIHLTGGQTLRRMTRCLVRA